MRNYKFNVIAWFKIRQVKELLVLLFVVVSFSLSIVYANVQSYHPKYTSAKDYTDTLNYIDMYSGKPVGGIVAHRPLVPFLARLMPNLPAWLFNPSSSLDYFTVAVWKFGIVNLFFLIGACLALYVLQQGFGMDYYASFLGVLLFLGSRTVIRGAGLPMVDTAFFFFFLLCLISIQKNKPWFLLVVFTLGMCAKELVILSLPLIFLTELPWRRKFMLLFCLFPGIFVYSILCLSWRTPLLGGYVRVEHLVELLGHIRRLSSVNGLIDLFFSFGLVWILFVYALVKVDLPLLLRRWFWLVPIVFAGVIWGIGNFSRSMFSAFPVVIPVAALGLSRWLTQTSECKVIKY